MILVRFTEKSLVSVRICIRPAHSRVVGFVTISHASAGRQPCAEHRSTPQSGHHRAAHTANWRMAHTLHTFTALPHFLIKNQITITNNYNKNCHNWGIRKYINLRKTISKTIFCTICIINSKNINKGEFYRRRHTIYVMGSK